MPDINERVAALEMLFGKVNLGDWSNDQDVPWWLAPIILPQRAELQAELHGAINLATQAKLSKGGEGTAQLMSEIIDDWCGTRVPGRFPPRPHWGSIVAQLGALAERLPAGSARQDAAFELCRRVVERAHEIGRRAK